MANQLPVKSLVKLNWIVSLMCSVVIFIFLFSSTGNIGLAVNCFFQTMLFFADDLCQFVAIKGSRWQKRFGR